jgi:serpin B
MIEAMLAMPDRNQRIRALIVAFVLAAFATGTAHAGAAAPPTASHRPTSSLSPAQATEAFGLALMHRLPQGNLVFSPDSIEAALAMAGTGAGGQTATQVAQTLHLSSPTSFAAVGRLQQAIAAEQSTAAHGSTEAPTLNIANGLFVQQGFSLEAPFTAGLAQSFAASPQAVDFTSPSAVEAINNWIDQQTHGLIPRLVGELSRETRLALANAIYLKAAWSAEFKARETRSAPFHASAGKIPTAFMHEGEDLPYLRGPGYAALSLPYRDSTLSLLVVLPVGESLARLERHLDAPMLDRIVRGLRKRTVFVSLPRFHLQIHTELNAPLQSLGMTDAFAPGRADFSAITQREPLNIGEVLHAADFKIDEQGTEAAAVTVVTVEASSALVPVRPPVKFNANHPFLFFLRDDRSGALLFAGRLTQPED